MHVGRVLFSAGVIASVLIGVNLSGHSDAVAGSAAPAGDGQLAEKPAQTRDAEAYATEYDVSLDEALRRLALQAAVGDTGAQIADAEPGTYAGRWIDHRPTFRVTFALTDAGDSTLAKYLAGTELEAISELHDARYSLHELEERRAQVARLPLHSAVETSIDERANSVVVYTEDHAAFLSALDEAQIGRDGIQIEGARVYAPAVNMYGGHFLQTCTAGFSVHDASPSRDGLLTAGHCQNTQQWGPTGQDLTFVAQNRTGPHDEQWHVPLAGESATFKNWALESGSEYRLITAKRSYNNQSLGDWVCKWAFNTGYGCGDIVSKFAPICGGLAADSLGIQVHNPSNVDLADGGGSGGPWYAGGTALGITSCETGSDTNPDPNIYDGHDATYVAVNYVEAGLGVTVKTAP